MADGFEQQDCISCFMKFLVPNGFTRRRREDRKSFYCPGCGQCMSYKESETDRLRRELDRAKQNEAFLNDNIRWAKYDAERERRRRIALSGQVTKMKNRAAAGTCPCCHRTFKQLAAHMSQKHPAFKAEPMDDTNVVPLKEASRA